MNPARSRVPYPQYESGEKLPRCVSSSDVRKWPDLFVQGSTRSPVYADQLERLDCSSLDSEVFSTSKDSGGIYPLFNHIVWYRELK